MDFRCPGVRGVVRYNKTNMTSLWDCQHDSLPLVSIVTLGLRPRVPMLTRGRQSCWQTHRDVIFVYCYTSRENTLILLDESHVSKLLATSVSVGSLTAVTIRRIGTRCQGAVKCKPTVS